MPGDVGVPLADTPVAAWPQLALVLAIGALGGWVAQRLSLPAAWLLGAVLAVGALAASGAIGGRLPTELLAAAQVIVGMALGARFERKRLASIPRAIAAGIATLSAIILFMAGAAALAAVALGQSLSSLVLAFSIGGMAEMVLTAKALNQDLALVAAFQAVRGVVVNAMAGRVWRIVRGKVGGGDG